MSTHNAANERIKRQYFTYLKEATRLSEPSVDAAAKAIARFESHTEYSDFKSFHPDQAVAFKKCLAEVPSESTGQPLSKSTLNSTLTQLKRFFQWLAWQRGYKSCFSTYDAEYFNLSAKEARIATSRRKKPFPTVEQVKHVLATMPSATEIEQRNRAVVAFTLLTGARDSATASFKMKHVDLIADRVHQDAREVKTKFSKSFDTYFFQVGLEVRQILVDWVNYLKETKLWGNDDPLFPATNVIPGPDRLFVADGVKPEHWGSADPIRQIFRQAFPAAGLRYFNPHSLRDTLAHLAQEVCKSPREFKAWSQNLGHEDVLTTFNSYGTVADNEQSDIIRGLSRKRPLEGLDAEEIAEAVVRRMISSTESGQRDGFCQRATVDSGSPKPE